MRDRLKHIVVPALLCIAAGCAAPEIEHGIELYHEQDYDGAVGLLEKGLRLETDRGWYSPRRWLQKGSAIDRGRITVRLARIRAAEVHADVGYRQYLDGNMKQAQEELRRAAGYDPTNTLAVDLLSQTTWQRELAGTRISKAQELIAGKSWDEALAELEAILYLTPTYPTIGELYERSAMGSFTLHLDQGKRYFESGAYARGVEEFKIALARNPDSPECTEWYRKCLDHRRAGELCSKAASFYEAGEYAGAYDTYGEALEWVASFAPALDGQKAARDRWVDTLFAEAQEHYQRGGKANCIAAHELLGQCEELYPGHGGVAAFRPRVKRRLSEFYAAEARHLLRQPGGARAATAWLAARKAHEFDPNVAGVPGLADGAEALLKAVVTRFVKLTCEGDEAAHGDQGLAGWAGCEVAARSQAHDIACAAFSSDPERDAFEQMKRRAAEVVERADIPYLDMTVAMRISLDKGRKYKLEERTSTPTREFVGEKSVKNAEWERTLVEFQKDVEDLAGLHSLHQKHAAAYEAAKVARLKADAEYEASRTRYGLLSGLRESHNSRGKLLLQRGLPNGASREFESYKRLDEAFKIANSARERLARISSEAHDTLRRCSAELDAVTRSVRDMEARLSEQLRLLDFERPQKLVAQYEAYEVFSEKWACTAEVRIESEIRSDGEVLSKPMVALDNHRTAAIVGGAHLADAGGFANQPDPLPTSELFLKDLEQQAVADYLQQLLRFFSQDHQSYFDRGRAAESSDRPADALEYYIRYVYVDGGKTQQRYRQAAEFVEREMKKPLAPAGK